MTNIVMITKGRINLAFQAFESIRMHTDMDSYNLTIVDDGSDPPIKIDGTNNVVVMHVRPSKGIVGLVRNIGASVAEQYWGPSEYICFLDNDVCITSSLWLHSFQDGVDIFHLEGRSAILGGQRHPFHGVNLTHYRLETIEETDAVAGYSLFMRWDTWKKYGPFPANQPGTGASEDYALCRRVVDDGGLVGYVHPPVLAHCGITNTDGKPATGADQFERVPGLLYL